MAYIQVAESDGQRVARGPVHGLAGPGLGLSFDDIVAKAGEYVDKAQEMGGMVQQALNVAMPFYESQVATYRPWLYDQGKKVGKAVVDKAWETASAQVKRKLAPPPPSPPAVGPPAPPAPQWLQRAIDPVIDPFIAGVRSEIDPIAYKAAGIAGGITAAGALFVLFLGYQWGKSRGRRLAA